MIASAIIVTRGDVELDAITEAIAASGCFAELIVWDNSERPEDLAVYGRYEAIREAMGDVIYVQDDDCVVFPHSIKELMRLHEESGEGNVICNQPVDFRHEFYVDHALVGFGAVFQRDLPERAFERFNQAIEWPGVCAPHYGITLPLRQPSFHRTCDIVFTALTPRVRADVAYENLWWAEAPDRMWKQPEHVSERARMLELVRRVRDE